MVLRGDEPYTRNPKLNRDVEGLGLGYGVEGRR